MYLAHTSGQVLLMAGLYSGSSRRSSSSRVELSSPSSSAVHRLAQSTPLRHLPSCSSVPPPPHRLRVPHRLVNLPLPSWTRTARRSPTASGRLPRDKFPLIPFRSPSLLAQAVSEGKRGQGGRRRRRGVDDGESRLAHAGGGRCDRRDVGAGRTSDGKVARVVGEDAECDEGRGWGAESRRG